MRQRYLYGWLIALLVFLFLIFRKIKANSPETRDFKKTLQKILSGTKYYKLWPYWFDVANMETAGFTSKLYLNANNPWGMKNPEKRQTTARKNNPYTANSSAANRNDVSVWQRLFVPGQWFTGAVKDVQPVKWARYETIEDAVNDIVLYMDEFQYKTEYPTLLAFIQAMKSKGYFSESVDDYYKKVKAWQGR